MPLARKQRLMATHGLSDYDADLLVRLLAGGADYFEALVAAGAPAKPASNWMQGEVRRKLKEVGEDDMRHFQITPDRLAELIVLADRGVARQRLVDAVELDLAMMRRLRAIGAVLGAAAGLDRQQRRALHGIGIKVFAMHRLGAIDEIIKR